LKEQTLRFAEAARRFCALVEGGGAIPPDRLGAAIAELCAEALLLPEVEPTDRGPLPSPTAPAAPDFGLLDYYREIFDPYDEDAEVMGSVSDDVSDIYRDVKEGLSLFDAGGPDDLRDAAWHWRFTFFAHWGEHATGALRALYWIARRDA
jgi:hypothetical protein